VKHRAQPRPAGLAVSDLAERLAPLTTLAVAQRAWPEVVGPAIAAQAHPTGERAGVLTVTCTSAVWAQELDLMGPELTARINAALGTESVRGLRCSSAPAKGWS
jgi:predicted nucleic acid-binding Zn ribbon protein